MAERGIVELKFCMYLSATLQAGWGSREIKREQRTLAIIMYLVNFAAILAGAWIPNYDTFLVWWVSILLRNVYSQNLCCNFAVLHMSVKIKCLPSVQFAVDKVQGKTLVICFGMVDFYWNSNLRLFSPWNDSRIIVMSNWESNQDWNPNFLYWEWNQIVTRKI